MKKEIAKNIQIAQYLATKNIYPQRVNNNSLWYQSPFRKEEKASFKVNTSLNKWIDFGTNQKGDIIDLVKELENIDNFNTAIQFLKSNFTSESFSFRGNKVFDKKNQSTIINLQVKDLKHPALVELLKSRKIPFDLAKDYCKELHYTTNGKHYFTIGFKNNKGGFATLNPYFKGCIAPNDISSFENNKNTSAIVFEGFMDFLSYLVIKGRKFTDSPPQDYHILNSVNNLEKLLPKLNHYEKIYCFLDNDTAGKNALKKITDRFNQRVIDQSIHYRRFKDINEQLVNITNRKSGLCQLWF